MQRSAALVYIHFVWGTWDRLPLLVGEAKRAVYSCIHSECATLKAEIVALGGVEDHIHLLATLPATVSMAMLVKQLKGSSSHLATRVPNVEFFKWQGAYSATSVCPSVVPQVILYIENQERHHRHRSIDQNYEL